MRGWSSFAIGLMLALGMAFAQQAPLTILHFNDVYEIQPVDKGKRGGAARIATLVDQYKALKPLILFSGDALSPSVMSSVFKGEQMIAVFNQLGLNAATYGNHEFDFGPTVTQQRVKESKFPWISTNILGPDGKPVDGAVPWVLLDWNGVKVGLLGLADNWLDLTSAGPDAKYQDFIKAAQQTVPELKAKGAQVIIALTHMTMADDEQLAASVPGLDLILGGHDHEPMWKVVNGTLIWKTGSDWRNLGLLKVYPMKGLKALVIPQELVVNAKVAEQPAMKALVSQYSDQLSKGLAAVVGEAKVPLDAREKMVRAQEAPLGDLIADAMRAYTKADVAITNGGGIRTDRVYEAGPITKKDILSILPFGNTVISLKLTGEQLKAALENGVSQVEKGAGRFPQVSGLSFTYDPSRPVGQRVLEVKVGSEPLNPTQTYVVATNDYMGNGGDGYSMLKGAPRVIAENSAPLMAQVVMDYIQAKGSVAPQVEGRIVKK
ncbi:bifunctional metallophosphatase/5'-nucleotidase [Meiothermus granaticius]|uniref:Trifunctional nucleotide phosphoesterase protein YfkN n=1 Tax=Meiothermus granaticius NBRC 107808 TaxID=1227551 RepID=A0A399FAS8_9DEIN|nr:5'-nucleotidase C-terminal domain-containing protein [Meiothermus granaticius]RIH92815.1 Trifunctional nucleotide phosphoesterase protein YfkN [Meiothermus granaticius NBRC 107808]GEM85529.1 multifunctional 2',3'-cyclic-nucleotide 2'-phosphodiesterase/5'-nucleotidase/3'-nucleotidase [Meiothermus granaticius NBRC 107808]